MQPEQATADPQWRVWRIPALLWLAAAPWLIWPLAQPHGQFLWGRYRFLDLYIGLPLALAALGATIVALQPASRRRLWAFRFTAMWLAVVGLAMVLDLFYALFVVGAWKQDYWLDLAFIQRRYSAPDAELGFVRRPNITWHGRLAVNNQYVDYRTDEHGFRNPPGLARAEVAFIGDSYTEAAQMTEAKTFVQRVGAATGLRVINLGRGAYGPPQEVIVLKRYGLSYQPRAVVWQLFEGNDLNDAHNYVRWQTNPQAATISLPRRYLQNSLLQVVLAGTIMPEKTPSPVSLHFQDGERLPIFLRYGYEPHQSQLFPQGLRATEQALLAGQALCRAQGIELLVVYVPIMARVLEPWLDFNKPAVRTRYVADGAVQQPTDTGQQLAQFCAQHGIAFQDAFPALRQRAGQNNRGLYIPTDEHFDEGGHAVMAELISAWLRQNQLQQATSQTMAAQP
jgi:hypothetical protein